MPRVVHFEIQADSLARAMNFYSQVFDWQFEDYGDFVGAPYWGIITGDEGTPGINGGLLPRSGGRVSLGEGATAFVCTIGVDDFDAYEEAILDAGGQVAMSKTALTGVAWQGYFLDTEGNTFGLHQPDPTAA